MKKKKKINRFVENRKKWSLILKNLINNYIVKGIIDIKNIDTK